MMMMMRMRMILFPFTSFTLVFVLVLALSLLLSSPFSSVLQVVQVVEATYSNTVLFPVSGSGSGEDNNDHHHYSGAQKQHKKENYRLNEQQRAASTAYHKNKSNKNTAANKFGSSSSNGSSTRGSSSSGSSSSSSSHVGGFIDNGVIGPHQNLEHHRVLDGTENDDDDDDNNNENDDTTTATTTTTSTTRTFNNNNNKNKLHVLQQTKQHNTPNINPEGAPTRYLEYEGPDATYMIRLGRHKTISYPLLESFTDTEIRIQYKYTPFVVSPTTGKSGILQVDDCPRHFLWLSDQTIQKELDYRLRYGRWSERTLLEKSYFTLFYGKTGLASHYMDSVDDFQTDLQGWDIMNRSSNHCEWEGIECSSSSSSSTSLNNNNNNNLNNLNNNHNNQNISHVIGFAINGFSLEGTLPNDLYQLSYLQSLDLHGNMLGGSIPSSWGNLKQLRIFNVQENSLTGSLPKSLEKWTKIQNVLLHSNLLTGTIPEKLIDAWTKKKNKKNKQQKQKSRTTGTSNTSSISSGNSNLVKEEAEAEAEAEAEVRAASVSLSEAVVEGENNKSQWDRFEQAEMKLKQAEEKLQQVQEKIQQQQEDKQQLQQSLSQQAHQPDDNEEGGLQILDLYNNRFKGKFPFKSLIKYAKHLQILNLGDNFFSGSLPNEVDIKIITSSTTSTSTNKDNGYNNNDDDNSYMGGGLSKLELLNLSNNHVSGSLPNNWWKIIGRSMKIWNLSHNELTGTIPIEIPMLLPAIQLLDLSYNALSGTLPHEEIVGGNKKSWSNVKDMYSLLLSNNHLNGTIPTEFLYGLSPALIELDLADNLFEGTLPKSLGRCSKLERFDIHNNTIVGTLPQEMNRMYPDIKLNLTDNLLTGTVPKIFCGGGAMSSNILFRQFGCDAIICPKGTYHPNGAASLYSGCRPCPASSKEKIEDDPLLEVKLGRSKCDTIDESDETMKFVHGDLDGDGDLSEREALRLLYTYTIGKHWGLQFESWGDPTVNKCDLNGVTCADGDVVKIDLTDASMCINADRKPVSMNECLGIPAEISKLTSLEQLVMNRRQFLRGTMPSEIGLMTSMKYLDISSCPLLTGKFPTEIGKLTNLKYLNIGGCRFNGTIPDELLQLSTMEKLHLSMNDFSGTISSSIHVMTNLKELMLSRTYVEGTIPENIGDLTALENLEMYGNHLSGKIPDSLGSCTYLKRIDLFNNELTGTIPESLTDIEALQILHIRLNHLTGTISSGFGELPHLSWFDVSTNHLHGTIPNSFAHSDTLKDFRLGSGNMIHNPIPKALCRNSNLNGGLTKQYGCAGVICPLGTYSDPGHATHSGGCKLCPIGRTTMYLGSARCVKLTDEDILTMFYDVMSSSNPFPMQQNHWELNRDGPICTWNGVECRENDKDETVTGTPYIESIWFPLLGLNEES